MSDSKGLLFLTIGLAALAAGGCGPSDEPEGEEAEPTPQASIVTKNGITRSFKRSAAVIGVLRS